MTGYAWPAPSTTWVTCSWQCHKDRNPPSSEPGTDIGTSYGSLVVAPGAGVVTYVKHDNSGGMGRTVQVLMDDGRETRPMHMSEIWVGYGQRVGRDQALGLSGASGYGDDWYYGPHVHQTLWDGPAWSGPTIDFALYVGDAPPPPPIYDPGVEMELVIKAPNGIVVHFAPGIRYDFPSVAEYAATQAGIDFFRAHDGSTAMPLPGLDAVVGVDWDTYKRFCAYFGVAEV